MKQTPPPEGPSDVELPPVTDLDATSVHARVGPDAFVVSAYDRHHGEVFAFLVRATRDRSLAEDLLRETFRRLAQDTRDGRTPVEVRRWLYRVASDLVISSARRTPTARRQSPEPAATVREKAGEIELVLAGLSTDARLGLLLAGEGFTGEEVATAIGQSPAATRILLARARARVRLRRELFAEEAR
jgi:RNA polymerase sigma-70 factor (ECF subfamily)